MIIEGTFVASVVDIVAKKLVDIFGARADSFFDKDEVRAASYTSYKALRRMDDILGDVEKDITELDRLRTSPAGEDAIAAHEHALERFRIHLSLLSEQLQTVIASFSAMKLKMEIYQSMCEAAQVELAVGWDTNLVHRMFGFDYDRDDKKFDLLSLWADMKKSVEDARRAIGAFIKANYKIEQKESGR
ncbi:hypothetical protein [Bradyrhizobium sp. AZCC 2230]|uniref:hypothetical protein n=1 Tax=Bradyrhizobium sp. AZCC 2230 TaxID=3117021 RepID=UPI002FEF9111